jgi:hypothetical protein
VAIDERPEVRRAIEARLALALQEAGVNVGTTAGMLSLADAKTDKAAAAERLRSTGAQVVVIMRLVDSSMTYRESRPGQERYAGHVSGFQTGTWYDYYSVAFDDMSPTYGTLKQKVYLETGVFDLGTEKHVWSGLTRTGVKETTDRLTEMDNVVAKAVAAMRKDGIFP